MKKLYVLSIILLTVSFSFTVIAQEMGAMKKGISINFPEKIQKLVLDPLPAGTYSIGAGGYFETLQSAFDKLSNDGIAGEVILELTDNLYTAPIDSFGFFLNGPITGAGPNSRVTIKPAANKNVTIEGNNLSVLWLLNTSYVTFDGVSLTGATTLTIHTLHNATYTFNDGIDFINNSDHNVMQNIIFIDEDDTRSSGSGVGCLTGSSEVPDSNLIQNNFVKQAGIALFVTSFGSSARAKGNIIRGNQIGSESDSLVAWGIQIESCQNTLVENNIVQNIRPTNSIEQVNPGINSYSGSGDIIRNNIVHNIKPSIGYSSTGILLSGGSGSNNSIYNNMVYDIQSTSPQSDSRAAGIQIWLQTNPKIYYNTVYLSGNGTNHQGSAAFYVYSGFGSSANVETKNNIFVNTRDESPYCASSIYDYTASNLTTDYNDLYYAPNQYNCLVKIGSNNYQTLADWQATGQDINSITEMPNFIDPYLHIDESDSTYLESGAIPISGIDTDFDGDLRNATNPDIGADEFEGIRLPVELTSFTATANGKEVILNWSTATELNNHGFEIQRSTEGIEFLTVGFAKGHGTTTELQNYSYADKNLNNGKYYYRLKQVDYDGSYEYSEVVEIEWRAFSSYMLEQNYPNPFNPTTTIGFGIQNKSNVKITVLNAIGEEVAVLLNEEKEAGYHQVEFNAANLPSGVYFYRIKADGFTQTKKMILLK